METRKALIVRTPLAGGGYAVSVETQDEGGCSRTGWTHRYPLNASLSGLRIDELRCEYESRGYDVQVDHYRDPVPDPAA
ncbi:hypothetical protein [Methylorubrum thiocyanatum]|uniref:hypothetical protein n=1 Tax=Methylorubrum thiocyanatum TaxID=47958 RepID=UPI0035C7C323